MLVCKEVERSKVGHTNPSASTSTHCLPAAPCFLPCYFLLPFSTFSF